jgi:mannose/cellobiose epimerase-like protein (N-acyl-D-glucosamine 2-epimerase family)
MPAQFYGALSGLLGRARAIEQAALAIQVTPSIGLQPVREGAEQQMARKVRRRWAAERSMPTASGLGDNGRQRRLETGAGARATGPGHMVEWNKVVR